MKRIFAILSLAILLLSLLSGCVSTDEGDNMEGVASDGQKQFFKAEIIEMSETSLLIRPLEEYAESRSSERISVANWFTNDAVKVGDIIGISHSGAILESYPAQLSKIFYMEYYDEHGCITTIIEK